MLNFKPSKLSLALISSGLMVISTQSHAAEESTSTDNNTAKEIEVIEHVKDIKDFYSHLINYGLVVGAFFILNILFQSDFTRSKTHHLDHFLHAI